MARLATFRPFGAIFTYGDLLTFTPPSPLQIAVMDNQALKYFRALPTTVDGLPVATTCIDITDNDPIQISLSEGADIQVGQSIVPSAFS